MKINYAEYLRCLLEAYTHFSTTNCYAYQDQCRIYLDEYNQGG